MGVTLLQYVNVSICRYYGVNKGNEANRHTFGGGPKKNNDNRACRKNRRVAGVPSNL